MADQLDMGGLNLGNGPPGQQRSYIPPHLRNRPSGPPPNSGPMPNGAPNGAPGVVPNGAPNGLNNSTWAGSVLSSSIPIWPPLGLAGSSRSHAFASS